MTGIATINSKYGTLEFTAPVCKSNPYAVKYLFLNGKQLFNQTKDGKEAICVTYNDFSDKVKSYHKNRMAAVRLKGIRYV